MSYDNEKKEKPVQTHRGAEEQKEDYSKFRRGGNTSRATIPEGKHFQSRENKGYKPRPK